VAKKRASEEVLQALKQAEDARSKAISVWNYARAEKARAEGKPYAVGAGRKLQPCFCRLCKAGGECEPAKKRRIKREGMRLLRAKAAKK
jgi:hypothetical protein